MRRALMTMRPFGGAPFTVGSPAIDRVSSYSTAGAMVVPFDNPAPRAGTVTSASIYATTAGSGYVVTGTYDGSSVFTVTAVSSLQTTSVGLNSFSVNLAINSGGHVGWYQTTGSVDRTTTGGSTGVATGSTPTPGATYTPGSPIGQTFSIEGTGS